MSRGRTSPSHPKPATKIARRNLVVALATSSALASAAIVGTAGAVSTERFVLDDAEALAAGELIRTAVHSDGRVTIGVALERVPVPEDVAVVYSVARAADGTVYLGTGNDGRVLRMRGNTVEAFAQTGQLLVASLAIGDGGTVYAGTLPEGRIYAIGADGQAREIARPEGTEHVWALAWDGRRRILYAGTGPEGRVYAIGSQGSAPQIVWDANAAHVMSLALGGDGTLYAGTSDEAIVARITAPNRAEIVHDFPGNEITSIAVQGNVLAVAANEFAEPPSVAGSASPRSATGGRAPRPRPGKGRIWRVDADGRAEQVYARNEGHVTSVELTADGTIYGGIGHDGLIVRVNPNRTHAIWVDVDERQVLAIRMDGNAPLFVAGDGAAVYRITNQQPRDAIWESKVLDARFVARWGQLDWRARGQLVLQTRSGNTERPEDGWSEWSAELTAPGPIRSPRARYLQIRALFARDPNAELRAVSAYFLPQNQRALVRDVHVEGANSDATKKMRAERQDHVEAPSSAYKIAWSTENPDGDRLRYRLRFRRDGQTVWRDMLREHEIHTSTDYTWQTESLPDGFYVVRVEASDELDNPGTLVVRDAAESEPIRIDNHAPRIEQLRFAQGRLTGTATDALGPIARLEYAVDGGTWQPFFPVDDLFDTAEERFEIDLRAQPGDHIVAVRATDASGNVGSAEAQARVGP